MVSRSSLLRTAAAATMTCTMAAAPALAREDVAPAPTPAPAVHVATTQRPLPPRVERMGVKPVAPAARANVPGAAAAIPVGLAAPASPHGTGGTGLDWLSAAIGALALVAALLIARIVCTSSVLSNRRPTPPVG